MQQKKRPSERKTCKGQKDKQMGQAKDSQSKSTYIEKTGKHKRKLTQIETQI
jgi:hypothetical protein